MPFQSDAQRKFLFAKHPKIAEEFAEATPKGADLPEHVKKADNMADGGITDGAPKEGDEFTKGLQDGINHDSDAVQSYLKSKFQSLIHPMSETDQAVKQIGQPTEIDQIEAAKKQAEGMSEGGYPHVTFLENVSTPEMKKTVHLEDPSGAHGDKIATGHEENYAEGGTVHKAEGRNKEPAKPANINTSHEEKLTSIYKAMGMGKYAIGGVVAPQPSVGPQLGMPNQADPNFWEQVKAALSKVSAPITGAANAALSPVEGAAKMAAPLVPPAVSAINKLTGASLPVPPPSAASAPDLGAPTPLAANLPPATPPAKPPMPAVAAQAAAPNPETKELSNLFNQDTSKLTEGVEASDRQKVADTMSERQHGAGSVIAEALAGLGDAIAARGGRDQHSLKDIFSMQKQQRDEALANFDKNRQTRLEKLDLQTKMGNNTIQKLAAQDAYGVDEHLNKQLGAPAGTAHKDLPLYMQMMTAKAAQSEKDADLYMKAHAQAASEIDAAVKNAGIFNIKPSPAQLQASGAKLADQYYNRAKGNILFQPSDGQKPVWIPAKNAEAAKKMDPNGQVVP